MRIVRSLPASNRTSNPTDTSRRSVSVSAADAAENDELLDCLRVVGTHINKHKDILESGQTIGGGRGQREGKRPSHVSILESAQTWRLTLLSVISALSRRAREETIDSSILEIEADITSVGGEEGMTLKEAMASPVNRGGRGKKASQSPIDGIKDSETRQRVLLKIAEGGEGKETEWWRR